jgi:hypothetical protein
LRRAAIWQCAGLVSGALGSVLAGAVAGFLDPRDPLLTNMAGGALVLLGGYLATSFIWLPVTAILIVSAVFVSDRNPRLNETKLTMIAAAIIVLAIELTTGSWPDHDPDFRSFVYLISIFAAATVVPPALVIHKLAGSG